LERQRGRCHFIEGGAHVVAASVTLLWRGSRVAWALFLAADVTGAIALAWHGDRVASLLALVRLALLLAPESRRLRRPRSRRFGIGLAVRRRRAKTGSGSSPAVKLNATQVHGRAVDAGVQLHGGYGYIMVYAIAGAFADARFLRLHAATSEAMRDAAAGVLDL
jgi:alkylation response protein AidB-like acyl-CoA dehydrogenase